MQGLLGTWCWWSVCLDNYSALSFLLTPESALPPNVVRKEEQATEHLHRHEGGGNSYSRPLKVMEQVGPLSVPVASVSFLLCMLLLTDSQAPSRAPPPPAPKLSVYPLSHVFTRGQQIWLDCSPPEGQRTAGFRYYKKSVNGGWLEQSRLEESIVSISTLHLEQQETFVCSYWEESQTGRRNQSKQSNQVEFSILEPPATLLLDPQHPVYIQGEQVTLHCLAPDGQKVTSYTFYKVQRGQSSEKLSDQQAGPYAQFRVEDQTAGEYSCEYQLQLSGRETRSQPSNLVSVAMTGRPPSPHFSITPMHKIYKTEESIDLTCSIPGHRMSKSLFFKDGKQVQQLTPTSTLVTSVKYTKRLLPQDGGTYSCRYQVQEATRDISSLDSTAISFQVLGPLPPPDFSVSPKRDVYRSGEFIHLDCSTHQHLHGLKFLFFKDKQLLHLASSPSSKTLTHFLQLSPLDSGRYFCRYQFVESKRQIQSGKSSFFQVSVKASPFDTEPTFSTTVQAAQTAMGLDDYTGTSTVSVLPSTSSQVGAGIGTPTCVQDPWVTPQSPVSQSSPSQDPITLTTHLGKSSEATDSSLTSSQPMGHLSSSTSARSQGTPRPPVTMSKNPRETTQSSEHSEGWPRGLLLAIGCGSGGAFILLVLLVCLYWRKQKGSSRISARAYWKSMELRRSMRMRHYKDPVGIAITLQERDEHKQTWPGSQDWGLLPKCKTPASNLHNPLKVKGDEDADSGAEFEFPEIDPTYMLLGFSCSTFREEGNSQPKEEPHVFNEQLHKDPPQRDTQHSDTKKDGQPRSWKGGP